MLSRIFLSGFVLLLAGCANEVPGSAPFGEASHLGMFVAIEPARAAATHDLPELKKTIASKVLTSMAFERVTGLPSDPARLLELD